MERVILENALAEALAFSKEGYTTDIDEGVIFRAGDALSERRVSLEVWMFVLAINCGYGLRPRDDREKKRFTSN